MNKKTKAIKELEELISDEDIELKPSPPVIQQTEKPKRNSNYVLTDARKAQFERAREIRMEKLALKKQMEEEQLKEYKAKKEALEKQKQDKIKKKAEKELKKLEHEVEEIDDVEVLVEKKPKKSVKKKKIIKYISESESESEPEEIIEEVYKKKPKQKAPPAPTNQPRTMIPIVRYF